MVREMSEWQTNLLGMIRRASTDLPPDVESALGKRREEEAPGSLARETLGTLLENTVLARRLARPLCQDTGTLVFRIHAPVGFSHREFERNARTAVVEAVEEGTLRRNCVDPVTGENTGNGIGRGNPVFCWHEHDADRVDVALLQKGGGCENVGGQYALPDPDLGAGRDLDGVRRCALDTVFHAQGRGCAPGILAVVVGGDRTTGEKTAKEQFFRHIADRHPDSEIASLERRILDEANRLEIGPMGFGGKTTLLDVFAEALERLPASYFVTTSYMCWAFRRTERSFDPAGGAWQA